MKKFFKASNALTNPVSFFSTKFGKKKHNSKHDKEHISESLVEVSKFEDVVIEENVIQQEGAPLDEALVGTVNSLEIVGGRNPTQGLMINRSDETFSAADIAGFLNPDVMVNAPIQMNIPSVNTLKFYQTPETTKNMTIIPQRDVKRISHSDVMQQKIDDLEKTSVKQALEIEQLTSSINDCLARLASLESGSGKTSETPNSLKLSSAKMKDIQLRKSLVSPRTPVKNLRLSGTPTRRSANDLSNHKETTFLKGEGAMKIFLRGRAINLYAPSHLSENFDVKTASPEPDESLRMDWVYGYRGKDCRRNMYYLPTGDLVYFVAGIVVLHNLNSHTQRHYTEHNDDIKCLALHPDKVSFASGQVASHAKKEGKPHVRIWSSLTLQTLHVIGLGVFERAVAALAFSKSDGGNLLVTVDDANDHNVVLWNWNKKQSLSTAKSSTEAVVEVEFHPKDCNMIVTCGKNHLAFWCLEKNVLTKKTAIYEKYDKPKFVTCITFTEDGDLITGDSNGNIFIWNKDKRAIIKAICKAHNSPVSALVITPNKLLLSGGTKDSTILEWDLATKEKTSRSFQINEEYGGCRVICERENRLIVGTTINCIVDCLGTECVPILQGHSEELCAVYRKASMPTFVTGGHDKRLMVWDADSRKTLSIKQLEKRIHSIGLHPRSDWCVVGCADGHWLICDLANGGDIQQGCDGNELIQCCEFSPDGLQFALGSRDNNIYVYKLDQSSGDVTKIGKCVGHSSFITHLDWSSDSQYLRTNSGDYELLFWTSSDCKQVKTPSSLADLCWATCNCSLSFDVAGIWPEGSDGTDVNAVAKANSRPIMATADDYGKVNLYRFPVSQPKAAHKVYAGHSSHVTGVAFLHDDRRLVSIGGQDTAIVQWVVV